MGSVNCSACGHDNRDSARFCEECAAPLARSCASCGTQLLTGGESPAKLIADVVLRHGDRTFHVVDPAGNLRASWPSPASPAPIARTPAPTR